MPTLKRLIYNNLSNMCICALLAAVAICIYLRSINHLFIFDEVTYFVDIATGEPIRTVKDALYAMKGQFLLSNARIPVHFLIQLFSGVWGPDAFFIVNTALFILLIVLTMFVSSVKANRSNYILWLICTASFLNFFPEQYWLWTSINLAPNYMWPCIAIGGLYLFFERIKKGKTLGKYIWIAVPTALLSGWSHEGIGIPLAGAFGLYWLTHRKTVSRDFWILTIPLWVGAVLVMTSPHLYYRFQVTSPNIKQSWYIFDIIYIITSQQALIITCVMWIILWFMQRTRAKEFIYSNQLYIYSALTSAAFICLANNGPRSMMLGGYAGLILMMRFITQFKIWNHPSKLQSFIGVTLTFFFLFQQIEVVKTVREFENSNFQLRESWRNSPTGVVRMPNHAPYPWYVSKSMWNDTYYYNEMFPDAEGIRHNAKKCIVLDAASYENFLKDPSFFRNRKNNSNIENNLN